MKKILHLFFIYLTMFTGYFMQKTYAQPIKKIVIFHAGSLCVPFEAIEKQFEAKYPRIDIQRESGGSTKMARMIVDINKPADIMVAADYKVIDNLLIPSHANWNIRFATNQMVLTFTKKSKYADSINDKNWMNILMKKDVVWGHSDPNLDPCGYRSLMTMQLAEIFHKKPGLFKKLMANRPLRNIRPKSVELISLLETGNMDYAWEYMSVAIQHKLRYITFDDHINLGSYKYNDFYKQAKVMVAGKKPGQLRALFGKSCTYGITILKNAQNIKAAVLFTNFLLSPTGGLKVLDEMGQPPIIPCTVPTSSMYGKINSELKKYVNVK